MEILHEKVLHKSFGEGIILERKDDKIKVFFNIDDTRIFKYPDSFESFLKFVNKPLQASVEEELNETKKNSEKELSIKTNSTITELEYINEDDNVENDKHIITKKMAEISYDYAKKVYNNQYTISDAKFEVAMISGMNPGSAQDYIIDFNAMMQGEEYKRTMKNSDSKMFIENIKRDY